MVFMAGKIVVLSDGDCATIGPVDSIIITSLSTIIDTCGSGDIAPVTDSVLVSSPTSQFMDNSVNQLPEPEVVVPSTLSSEITDQDVIDNDLPVMKQNRVTVVAAEEFLEDMDTRSIPEPDIVDDTDTSAAIKTISSSRKTGSLQGLKSKLSSEIVLPKTKPTKQKSKAKKNKSKQNSLSNNPENSTEPEADEAKSEEGLDVPQAKDEGSKDDDTTTSVPPAAEAQPAVTLPCSNDQASTNTDAPDAVQSAKKTRTIRKRRN